ncbi:MAG: nucleoside triphosphate pyrophosphohydrolase [Desulfomicrobium sp.]|nr:nucleoside triphosphate pyrophosphohydrolase [Desulfomicrobium sp.]
MPETDCKFNTLLEIMRKLRGNGGCPWDAEQTHKSLKRYLLEETYEVIEAIDSNDQQLLQEELGDLLLQPVFHAVIAEEKNDFTMDNVIESICKKLIRRHPHVFGDQIIADSAAQTINWEKIKQQEKGAERRSAIAGIPPELPALLKALKITEKAARVGFDWENYQQVMDKVQEELAELHEVIATNNQQRISEELGDLIFALVNLGRFFGVDAEDALRSTIKRFESRFNHIEDSLEKQGQTVQNSTLEEMEQLWQEAKQLEK